MKKKSREKNKYLENENSFYDEIKPFLSFLEGFHRSKSNIFWKVRVSLCTYMSACSFTNMKSDAKRK